MGRRTSQYTPSEDEIILEELENYPQNFSYAFKRAADRLPGRTKGSVSGHYYSTLRDRLARENRAIVAVGSSKGVVINSKTVRKQGPSEQLLMIEELAFENLTLEERKQLVKDLVKSF